MLGGDEAGWPFKDWAYQLWFDKYRVKPPWLTADYVSLSKALKISESEAVARAAWKAYLASDDDFYQGHSPRKFLYSIDRWTVKAVPKPERKETFPGAARAAAMARVVAEVSRDESIPESEKRAEMSRRWREL
jgi:hypothetical protein